MRYASRGMLAGVLIAASAVTLGAQQQTGIVAGRVTERGSNAPLVAAQVMIVGTTRGTVTGEDGRYRLTGVPAGSAQLRVLRIGYRAVTQPITVTAGQTTTADVQLDASAVSLDQMVVSATGATERKRENGNDVGVIKPGDKVSIAATPTLSAVLTGKTAGLTVTQGAGSPGASSRIRIRGSNSVSLSNEPLLIIDGVRVNNDVAASSLGVGGQQTNRFDDINPEDIESIEVLKGPAASALYGTAAANGVIQIVTRKGRTGKTQWRAYGQYGTLQDPTDYPSNYFTAGFNGASGSTAFNGNCILDLQTRGLCRADQTMSFNPLTFYSVQGTGHARDFGASASGGGDAAQYFVSYDGNFTQGTYAPSKVRMNSGRANINARLRGNLTSQFTTNYVDRRIGLPYNDNNIYGVVPNGVLGKAGNCVAGNTSPACVVSGVRDTLGSGFYSRLPSTFYFVSNEQAVRRFIAGNNTTWQPFSWLTGVAQLGIDADNSADLYLNPANIVTDINQGLAEGARTRRAYGNYNYNANGSFTATRNLLTSLQSQTSAGGQFVDERRNWTQGTGRQLVPGTGSLATVGAGKDVNELNQEIKTVGGYVREQLAWRDRLFVTGALRADENSAFGKDFKLAYYPAASLSWVISEEPFFQSIPGVGSSSVLDQLRLRTSYGRSGQRPGFRQADTYLSAVSVANVGGQELTAVVIGGTGNAGLKPEISDEQEIGFDASFLKNRLGITYTFFNKVTRDALIAQTLAPSLGVSTSRFVNLGKVSNNGHELQVNATAVDLKNAKFTVDLTGSILHNELKQLGGVPPIFFNGSRQRHQEGYPLGAFFQRKYTFQDKNGDGIISRVGCTTAVTQTDPSCELVLADTSTAAQFIGSVLPTREFSVTPTLTLFQHLRVGALIQHRGGNYAYNETEEFRCTASSIRNCRAINDRTAPLEDQAAAIAYTLGGTSAGYIEKADYTKFRELSIGYIVPRSLLRFGGFDAATVTVAGRNLATWTKYKGFDPEVNAAAATGFSQFDFLTQPQLRMWTLRVDLTF
ncbi:TonB-dependent outer membrane protein, SusC/RagA [Gemmatirosa kalamazoonensis]|uniref:TonB-dependent outer membrane protein, SusC/RagA n=1 Tax=Gemmatirosa kalamazoonensis TaxID=861299 RepID=W0RIK3_9BACT|nr:SusC/RagA family TonB-linked outer membrane protein [Gemmatirosa kalamazoonensis]AHG90170.1 TonB-dependent outer membrane protein, SusC/RagA [Gemmatirosa kalamazoonensis]